MARKSSTYHGGHDGESPSSSRTPLLGRTIYQHFWKDQDDKGKGLIWVGVRSEIAKILGFAGDPDIPLIRTTNSGRRVLSCSVNIHTVQASGRSWSAIYPDGTEYSFKVSPQATRRIMARIASRWKNPPLALKPPKGSAFKLESFLDEAKSHVYLVLLQTFSKTKHGECYYKIGKAKHIPRRIKQFGPCKIIDSAEFPSERESLIAEQAIHSIYMKNRLPETEIFRFTEEQVESVRQSFLRLCNGDLVLQDKNVLSCQVPGASADTPSSVSFLDQKPIANSGSGQGWSWHKLYWKDLQAQEKGCIWVMPKGEAGLIFGINGDPDISGLRCGPVRRTAALSRGCTWLAYRDDGSVYTFKASPMATKKIMAQIASRWVYPPVKLKPPGRPAFRLHDLKDETYSYVYLVRLLTFSEDIEGECYYKIGKSNEIPKRIKQFGPCELVKSIRLENEKTALQTERAIHGIFNAYQCSDTEIFRFGRAQVEDVCHSLNSHDESFRSNRPSIYLAKGRL